jgi:hypothetical protein
MEQHMNKPVLGLVVGGILGILDGSTAFFSAPELSNEMMVIVGGSMIKGLVAGVIIGTIARKVRNLGAGMIIGLLVSALVTLPIALPEHPVTKKVYLWEIMIPGMIVGLIVGFATQKYGKAPPVAASR